MCLNTLFLQRMLKRRSINICFSMLVFCFPMISLAQDSIRISLLSCSPGTELYSIFGHSAFRIKNYSSGQDVVYNYGTFNFNDKNFYLKFLSGKLNYYLSVTRFDRFMYEYTAENRSVYEQVFSMNLAQKEKLYNDLRKNALPENRAYKYDFFWDNCSTRMRDMIQSQYADSLIYPVFNIKSFRSYLHDYLKDQPWSRFGIDLILGLPCDAPAGTREAMFLPLEMMKAYDSTFHEDKMIASHSREILSAVDHVSKKNIFTPLLVSILILLVSLFLKQLKSTKLWSNLFFIITGLAGCIIFFLWFLSDHLTTKNNLHFIWSNPLLLLYPFRHSIFTISQTRILNTVYFIGLALLILTFPISIQKMPLACVPLWLSLMVISWPETVFYEKWMKNWRKKG